MRIVYSFSLDGTSLHVNIRIHASNAVIWHTQSRFWVTMQYCWLLSVICRPESHTFQWRWHRVPVISMCRNIITAMCNWRNTKYSIILKVVFFYCQCFYSLKISRTCSGQINFMNIYNISFVKIMQNPIRNINIPFSITEICLLYIIFQTNTSPISFT